MSDQQYYPKRDLSYSRSVQLRGAGTGVSTSIKILLDGPWTCIISDISCQCLTKLATKGRPIMSRNLRRRESLVHTSCRAWTTTRQRRYSSKHLTKKLRQTFNIVIIGRTEFFIAEVWGCRSGKGRNDVYRHISAKVWRWFRDLQSGLHIWCNRSYVLPECSF